VVSGEAAVVGMSNPPELSLWLSVPDDCSMRAGFDVGDHHRPVIHIKVGGVDDDVHLQFERQALERFVQLAQRTLAVPVTPGGPIPTTLLYSGNGHAIREEPPAVG
jgi:hypothetical protein